MCFGRVLKRNLKEKNEDSVWRIAGREGKLVTQIAVASGGRDVKKIKNQKAKIKIVEPLRGDYREPNPQGRLEDATAS
jgi:hypothetical protein